jgi:RNA polymerase sigma-70 factor (ECF subfamily)
MSRYENLKNREIAIKLNITEKAVEANISRAFKILRVNLKDYAPLIFFLFP